MEWPLYQTSDHSMQSSVKKNYNLTGVLFTIVSNQG